MVWRVRARCVYLPENLVVGVILQWLVQASSKVYVRRRSGRALGPTGIGWTVCVCARHPWNATCQGRMCFFFKIQKERSTMPGSETVSPSLNADIRTFFFSADDVLEKCALVALHLVAEEGRGGENGCHALRCFCSQSI